MQTLPADRGRIPLYLSLGAQDDEGLAADTLSEAHILRRIGRIYRYQSELLMAEAAGDQEQAENLLELAMTELSTLMQEEGIMERPRFRELYRTVLTEHEKRYGPTDSLVTERGDIFQLRADIFAELNDVETPLLEEVMLPELQPGGTVFPMTMNRLVESSIKYLLRSPEKHLYRWLSRAETYFPMVEQIFREEGVPDELKYLAMIESGLNPTAQSWASAAGMWQFIRATGAAYGLDVTPYVDERMDPEKATRAAARHLRDLHEMFGGDWQLALAGYNCSPARIKRAIRRAEARLGRKATFWDIYDDIPRETRNYVPMFIAAALVASNPTAFDVAPVRPGPRYEYEHVPVPGMMSLTAIAEMAGTDVSTLRALNPELRRSVTPPTQGAYYLRLPMGTYEEFAAAYARAPKTKQRVATEEYVVRRGDSLTEIARRYDTSVKDLMQANGLRSTTIQPGQRLVVGTAAEATGVPPMNLADARPMRVQYGHRTHRPLTVASANTNRARPPATHAQTPVVTVSDVSSPRSNSSSSTARSTESASRSTRTVYKVRRGDSLTEIARRYGVTVQDLKSWNNLRSSTIHPGQRLAIHSDSPASTSGSTRAAASESKRVVYKVRRGDSLTEIARRHGVTVQDLKSWNNLRSSTIHTGQRLTIHADGAAASRTAERDTRIVYTVRRGDSLSAIATKYGVSVEDLKKWNKLRTSRIQAGQRLKIYS